MRPGVVAFDHEVFELVVEDGGGLAIDHKLRVRARRAGKLQLDLLEVVLVDVTVAARPDEVTHLEIALLRHHVREQRIAGDVKWHAQEDVATALIELAQAPASLSRPVLPVKTRKGSIHIYISAFLH